MAVVFTINGQVYHVSPEDVPVDTSLSTFIRNHAHLKGTKFMCLEGGCGACIVNIKGVHPVTRQPTSHAVNSCLFSVFSCHGMDILTVEGIGSKEDGYHPRRRRLAFFHGSQCGYCSPGMVMSMYSLLDSNKEGLSMEQIENSLGGNICRCTGYRPILDAFKSFAGDADEKLTGLCRDIEDLEKGCARGRTGNCSSKCSFISAGEEDQRIDMYFEDGREWHKVYSLQEIFDIFARIGSKPYMLVAGNTGHGVYRRREDLVVFIDVKSVQELSSQWIGSDLIVGANVTLNELIRTLQEAAASDVKFHYCLELAKHVTMIAHEAVRNVGTIAGNLSIKHQHHEFPSDLYLILESVGAQLTIMSMDGTVQTATPQQFLKIDMTKKLLLNVVLPALDPAVCVFRSYKVQPRAQNSKAHVNAAFMIKFNDAGSKQGVVTAASVCFGGIHPSFTHATLTEMALVGKNLFRNETLQEVLEILDAELHPDWVLPEPSPAYRKQTALGLLYRFVLNIAPRNVNLVSPRFSSGKAMLERPTSSGAQSYDTYPKNWPLTQNVPKIEALAQTSGEASYINDMPCYENELYAAYVTATEAQKRILDIDATEALRCGGVVGFFSAKDIPGFNDFMPFKTGINFTFPIGAAAEEVLCSGKVLYHGQPVGVIVAETFQLANHAANLVTITYSDSREDNIYATIVDLMEANATHRILDQPNHVTGEAYATATGEDLTFKGVYYLGGQYHYTMETHTCICVPIEDGMNVYSSSQFLGQVQASIAQLLKIPQNSINYFSRRLGGAYGSKATRSAQIASACALAAHHTRRPVRFVLTMEANMCSVGKRQGLWNDYEVAVKSDGKIVRLSNTYTHDSGCSPNEPLSFLFKETFKNCYDQSAWRHVSRTSLTDVASNTWLRAPGSGEAIATTETIMEHIAFKTGQDPLEVRMKNMPADSKMLELLPRFRTDVEFDQRRKEIDEFNAANRWRKRGISIVPVAFPINHMGTFDALVSIHHLDGSVSVTHSGIEMGQGIHTKAAQVAAHVLGIPLDKVSIKPLNSMSSPNAFICGGSTTNMNIAYAVQKACEILVERMQPIRESYPTASWEVLVAHSFASNLDLTARFLTKPTNHPQYTIWALCCTELELDILTGAVRLPRVDILEDTGESMNPGLDIGQVEGAFIMAVGYFLTESLEYDKTSGALTNIRSWNYKPPGAKDIPTDFRVNLLRGASNPVGALRSKGVGEPGYTLGVSTTFALRYALMSARRDAGLPEEWLPMGSAMTIDKILLLTGNTKEQFLISE
ncbi:xanthine dehydrogenase 1 [Culex quinquefasciatus]|uniref:xanthine dehydrogenase 1 n=1 Tax=Culex quinquefasciatus TaxID=7176 RepID=UPI0018E2DA20|nr:xanthine dehydrogenase 1 [Culex quinquefasciatus]